MQGYRQLLELLADAGDSASEPVPVAVETARSLLISCLRATGRTVYSINPMAVARYRERHTVARAKSDHADAMVLANILRTDADAHRPLPADSELAQAIAVFNRLLGCLHHCLQTGQAFDPAKAFPPPRIPSPACRRLTVSKIGCLWICRGGGRRPLRTRARRHGGSSA